MQSTQLNPSILFLLLIIIFFFYFRCTQIPDTDGTFPKSVGFHSHTYLLKSPQKFLSIIFNHLNASYWCEGWRSLHVTDLWLATMLRSVFRWTLGKNSQEYSKKMSSTAKSLQFRALCFSTFICERSHSSRFRWIKIKGTFASSLRGFISLYVPD